MAPRFRLTPIDGDTVLQHGMPFVIKWRNPASGKLDFWIGIHVPENIASGIRKPKNNASSDEPGESLKYLMYLPGRNVYRWIDIKSVYALSAYPPDEYEQDCREFPDIYSRLHAIAQQTSDIRFWASLARKEKKSKDRSDKVPSIDFSPAAAGADEAEESEADAEPEDDYEVASEFAGDIEGSATAHPTAGPQGQMEAAKRTRKDRASSASNKKAKIGAWVGQHQYHRPQQQELPEPDGEEVVDIYIGHSANDQRLFHLTRNKIGKSSFLNDCIQGKPPYIMHPQLHLMTPAEFEPIYAYLSRGSGLGLDSDLVSVHGDGADNGLEEEYMIGDVYRIGKAWMLKDVHSIEDLGALIPRLAAIYAQAHSFGLKEMASDVFTNLSVAWNHYGRVEQLPLFLDFIESVMANHAQGGSASGAIHGQSSSGLGTTQPVWIVNFLAETMFLYSTTALQRFWALLNKYPALRAAVLKVRGILDDAMLFRLEQKFVQQEPLTEASFVIPAKPEHSAEQGEAEKDEGMEQMAESSSVIPAKPEHSSEQEEAEKEDVMEQVAEEANE